MLFTFPLLLCALASPPGPVSHQNVKDLSEAERGSLQDGSFVQGDSRAEEKPSKFALSTNIPAPPFRFGEGAGGRGPQDTPDGPYLGYITYPGLQAKIAEWKTKYPDLVRETTLGKTLEGRPIPLLRIGTKEKVEPGDTEVLLLCGVHPREQQAIWCLVKFLDELLAGSNGKNARLTKILQTRQIWVVPMLNVDGKVYDFQHGDGQTKGADWRKNRRVNADETVGVDLNRNFGVRWGGSRALDPLWQTKTTVTSANIYEGPSPFSEPESRALADFMANRSDLRTMMDIHGPLHEILYPAYSIAPEWQRFQKIVQTMQSLQKGEKYKISKAQPNTEPPLAPRGGDSGLTYTWAYYTQGIYGFNFEVGIPVRYPKPVDIAREYETNVRDLWRYYLEAAGDLPPAQAGNATCEPGEGTVSSELTPGATVTFSPPAIVGSADYAVLVSDSAAVVVPSEYRLVPILHPFTLQVADNALPGTVAKLRLFLWDKNRHKSVVHFSLTTAAPVPNKQAGKETGTTAPNAKPN